jgi:hypothetical protein
VFIPRYLHRYLAIRRASIVYSTLGISYLYDEGRELNSGEEGISKAKFAVYKVKVT